MPEMHSSFVGTLRCANHPLPQDDNIAGTWLRSNFKTAGSSPLKRVRNDNLAALSDLTQILNPPILGLGQSALHHVILMAPEFRSHFYFCL